MAAGDGSNGRAWSELPADVLAAVYRGCSSAHDRARFAAVCAPWRAAVSWLPPLPALPLLLPCPSAGGRETAWAYSPEDGRAVRVPLPSALTPGMRLVGSHDGGWIAATSTSADRQHRLMILNLYSGAEVALSAKQRAVECTCSDVPMYYDANFEPVTVRPAVKKMVFSGDPSSSCCILAATTGICKLALCRVGCPSPDHGWTTAGCTTRRYEELVDISFCNGGELNNGLSSRNGKLFLYGISRSDQLLKFEVAVNVDGGGAPAIATTHLIAGLKAGIPRAPGATCHPQHIFELHGEVAIAVEQTSVHGEASSLLLHELAELAADDEKTRHRYTFMEVTSLDDHALFLSPACSKVVHVSAAGARGGVYRNCIYYPKGHAPAFQGERYMKRLDLGGRVVFSSDNDDYVHCLGRIMSKVYHYRCNNKDDGNGFTWFLPPDF